MFVGWGIWAIRTQIQQTLESIMRYNFREFFYGHFNHMRSFVLNDEAALLMATYPKGRRPERPFPYFTEVMTGYEYIAAIHMLYEGQVEAGMRCITPFATAMTGSAAVLLTRPNVDTIIPGRWQAGRRCWP